MKNGAVIGFGYWGQTLLKVLKQLKPSLNLLVFDTSKKARKSAVQKGFVVCSSLKEILESRKISFLIIATPPLTHYDLVRQGLDSNKHILVEKPFGLYTENQESLFQKARRKKKVLMVDYTYLYSHGFKKIKENLKGSKMTSYESLRMNFSFPRQDTNVIEDLIIQDLCMLIDLIPSPPLYCSCHPLNIKRPAVFQQAFVSITGKKWRAFIYGNRVFSEKQRTILVKSAKKAIEFKEKDRQTYIHFLNSGKIIHLKNKNSLEVMFEEFFKRIKGQSHSNDSLRYKKISSLLAVLNKSIKFDGKNIKIHWKV